jgi:hypothetical protein
MPARVLEEVAHRDAEEARQSLQPRVARLTVAVLVHRDGGQAPAGRGGDLRLAETGAEAVVPKPKPDVAPNVLCV